MYKKIAAISLFLLFSGQPLAFAENKLDAGSFSIGGRLQLDAYYHKVTDGWVLTKTGGGINKNYTRSVSTPVVNSAETVFGETFFFNVAFHPFEGFKGELDFEAIGDYADRYWMPVNLEHRMKLNGKSLNWNRADISYETDWWGIRYFRNIGHYNWSAKGDLFNLYPSQFETERYLRVSGRSVPEGGELNLSGKAGRLELIYGSEAIWDYKKGVYANYNFSLWGLSSNLMYRNHIIPYGDPDERMSDTAFSTTLDFAHNSLQVGALYQPFRLNRDYEYVEYVAPGEGYLGTRYDIKTGVTGQSDAIGYSGKLTLRRLPFANEVVLKYTHLGLVAGNKNQVDAQLTRKITRSFTGAVDYMYRKPLIGPIPLVYEGTLANPGPALLEPRDMNSPFWVSWNNDATGWDNRETNQISFTATFDPTPDTWFYSYEANKLEDWNLNPEENSPLSLAGKYTLSKYYSGTDRLLYWDENGNMVWEGPLQTEPWATDGYIGDITLIARLQLEKSIWVFNIGGGESLASNGFAYTPSATQGRPITSYFTTGISVEHKPYTAKIRYGADVWGPEDWQARYGQSFNRLYQANLTREFGDSIKAGIDYVSGKPDLEYYCPEIGDMFEVRCFVSISFGPLVFYTGAVPDTGPEEGQAPELDNDPPQTSLTLPSETFCPANGESLEFQAWAADFLGIATWKLEVLDPEGNAVKTFSGQGQPPYSIKWNGIDERNSLLARVNTYAARLTVKSNSGLTSQTAPVAVTLVAPKAEPVKEPEAVKVTETERGLLVSFSSKVLFDAGKSDLKSEAGKALDEVVKMLNTYENNKLSVEGHTDSTGASSVNLKLSEKRAKGVADYLVGAGIARERVSVTGYGSSKPIGSNATAKGREANRRVEVIILK